MAVATVSDVATSLGRPITDSNEVAQVEMWLGDAERQIRKRLGDVALLDQEDLAYVEREAVVLKVKRPDPAQRVEISVDDGRVAKSYEKDAGQVMILEEWWDLLTPTAEGGAFSIQPYLDPSPQPDRWVTTTDYLP